MLNVKCNSKHCTLEYLTKQFDTSQDVSRSGIFKRAVMAAETVENWMDVYNLLSNLKIEESAPKFTNWQAAYDEDTANILARVKQSMQKQLKASGVITRVLQTQFMLQLLMANYLEHLKQEKLSIKADKMLNEEITIPEISAVFTEMILTDKDCEALKEIRKILVEWRNAQ